MHALYRQAYEALNTHYYTNRNPVICYEEIDEEETDVPCSAAIYSDIQNLIWSGLAEAIDSFIEKYFSQARSPIPYARDLSIYIANAAVAAAYSTKAESDYGKIQFIFEGACRQQNIEEIKKWLRDLLYSLILADSPQGSATGKNHCVALIKRIIHERYMQQISIQEIAREVFFSAGYANAIFRKETGSTIFDYLQQYRMKIAKELLSMTDYKIHHIAEKSGYVNATHFSITFKKIVGISPVEYRNKVVEQ